MHTIHLMSGLPGSGKSTFMRAYAQPSDVVVSRDNVRNRIREELGSKDYFPIAADAEYRCWILECANAVKQSRVNGHCDVWFDQTSLNAGSIIKFLNALTAEVGDNLEDYHICVEAIHTPLNTCIERDSHRTGFEHVGEEVIRKMHRGFRVVTDDIRQGLPNMANRILVNHFNP